MAGAILLLRGWKDTKKNRTRQCVGNETTRNKQQAAHGKERTWGLEKVVKCPGWPGRPAQTVCQGEKDLTAGLANWKGKGVNKPGKRKRITTAWNNTGTGPIVREVESTVRWLGPRPRRSRNAGSTTGQHKGRQNSAGNGMGQNKLGHPRTGCTLVEEQ